MLIIGAVEPDQTECDSLDIFVLKNDVTFLFFGDYQMLNPLKTLQLYPKLLIENRIDLLRDAKCLQHCMRRADIWELRFLQGTTIKLRFRLISAFQTFEHALLGWKAR